MPYVIRLAAATERASRADQATMIKLMEGIATGKQQPGKYLEWSDPDANDGRGAERWTDDITKAKKFATFTDAAECWKAQSKVRPTRLDGKPNRPMTAYSVTILKETQ